MALDPNQNEGKHPSFDADVSIILPFHNAERYLRETLLSIERQSHANWHLIMVDDGSSDGSRVLAEEFAGRHPGKVTLLVTNGVGAAEARNLATDLAQSQFVAFLDADDVWTPDKLRVQISIMQQQDVVFCYTGYRKIRPDGDLGDIVFTVPESITRRRLLRSNPIRCFTVIYDQRRIGKLHMPAIKMRNDYLTWLDALERIDGLRLRGEQARVLGINEGLGFYRIHAQSLTGNKRVAAAYQWDVYRRLMGLPLYKAAFYFGCYAWSGIANRKRF